MNAKQQDADSFAQTKEMKELKNDNIKLMDENRTLEDEIQAKNSETNKLIETLSMYQADV